MARAPRRRAPLNSLLSDQQLLLDLVTDELVTQGVISAERFAELWMEALLAMG